MNKQIKTNFMIALNDIESIKWDENKATRLRELRGDRTLRDVALIAGISFQYLKKLEKAQSKSISMSVLINICNALGADVSLVVTSF